MSIALLQINENTFEAKMIPKFSSKKLMLLRRERKLSQEKLASDMGVVRQTIIRWERGESLPTDKDISKIERILEIEEDGLYETKQEGGDTDQIIKEAGGIPLNDSNTIRIPVVAEVPAGYPEYHEIREADAEAYMELPRYMAHGVSFAIKAKGDSMEPTISKGDKCLIRAMKEPLNNKIMLVRTPNGHTIKRIVKRDGLIELHSDNKRYEVFKESEISVIGKVVGVFKELD